MQKTKFNCKHISEGTIEKKRGMCIIESTLYYRDTLSVYSVNEPRRFF